MNRRLANFANNYFPKKVDSDKIEPQTIKGRMPHGNCQIKGRGMKILGVRLVENCVLQCFNQIAVYILRCVVLKISPLKV
jgi:hypothetical protein